MEKTRYIVDAVYQSNGRLGVVGSGGTKKFNNLSNAVKYFHSPDCTSLCERMRGRGTTKKIIAKEIFCDLSVEENEGKIETKIKSIGDFNSNEPYYIIDEFEDKGRHYSSCGGSAFEIVSYKDLNQLVQEGLPYVKGKSIIAHGLELKFEKSELERKIENEGE